MNTAKEIFHYSGTEEAMTKHAATLIIAEANLAVASRGRFSLVLAGGNSPRGLYRLLALQLSGNEEQVLKGNPQIPWKDTWIFWGDERCVPFSHPDSNYRMAAETLFSQVGPVMSRIFRIPAEKQPAEQAAAEYEALLRDFFSTGKRDNTERFPVFDLVLLGLGEDGHTASLFADNPAALQETGRWVMAVDAPHAIPPGKRITLTLPAINHARNILFFTTGKKKADLAEKIFLGKEKKVPAGLVKPCNGKLFWFTAQP